MVVNISVSFIPFLIVILFEVLMCGMDGEVLPDPAGQLQLLVDLVQEQVVLFSDHSVTIAAISSEYLETYIIYFSIK